MSRLSAEDKKIVARMKEIRELIAEFGLVLGGYDPGITASLKAKPEQRGRGYFGEAVSFCDTEWGWLEPLLKELLALRKTNKVDLERERCAKIAETEPEPSGAMPKDIRQCYEEMGVEEVLRATIRATKASIVRRIREGS